MIPLAVVFESRCLKELDEELIGLPLKSRFLNFGNTSKLSAKMQSDSRVIVLPQRNKH